MVARTDLVDLLLLSVLTDCLVAVVCLWMLLDLVAALIFVCLVYYCAMFFFSIFSLLISLSHFYVCVLLAWFMIWICFFPNISQAHVFWSIRLLLGFRWPYHIHSILVYFECQILCESSMLGCILFLVSRQIRDSLLCLFATYSVVCTRPGQFHRMQF